MPNEKNTPLYNTGLGTLRYYRSMDILSESDISDMSEAHIINCAGIDTLTEPFRTVRHFGRRDEYMIYVTEGEVSYKSPDGEIIELKQGMGIFLHSGHRQELFSSIYPTSFHWIHFTGHGALSTLERFGFDHEFVFSIGMDERILTLFRKIFNEFTTRRPDYIYSASLYLLQIFVEIERTLTNSSAESKSLEKSLHYIHSNYLKDISIEELSQIEHISISHYRKIFFELMGVAPKQYIISLRISYAASLLQHSDKSVKEIAEQCGYQDIGYFYRVFKKTTGITPIHCRNTKKSN